MKILNACLIFSTILLTNCATLRERVEELKVHERMEELKTFEEYATADTEIKNKNVLNAEITFMDGRNLKTKIKAVKGVINNSLVELSINKSVPIYDHQGKEDYISYILIQQLTFRDYEGKQRIFINRGDQFDSLLETMYAGRIKWYREFYKSPYNSLRNYYDIFVTESGEEINDKVAIKLKNKLIKATAEKPAFKEKIEQAKKLDDQTVIELLKEFEL